MHVVVENYEQTHTTVCVKTQDDAGIYDPCWVFTVHAGIYGAPFVSKLKIVLVFTSHVGIYESCWYIRCMMPVFTLHNGIYLYTTVR